MSKLDLMTCELVPSTQGRFVALGPRHQDFARALAEYAGVRSGWSHVSAETVLANDDLRQIIEDTWRVIAPGWLRERRLPDGSVADDTPGLIGHSGISHHLRMAGHAELSAERSAAVLTLRERPGLADVEVLSYLGYSHFPGYHRVIELLAEEGSAVATTEPYVDADTLDSDDLQGHVVTHDVPQRGQSIERWVLAHRPRREDLPRMVSR